jgi:hypothetical protein
MRRGLAQERLVAVFLCAVLLFNYPVLSIFDRDGWLLGMPVLYVFMFAAWAAVIAAVTWIAERASR